FLIKSLTSRNARDFAKRLSKMLFSNPAAHGHFETSCIRNYFQNFRWIERELLGKWMQAPSINIKGSGEGSATCWFQHLSLLRKELAVARGQSSRHSFEPNQIKKAFSRSTDQHFDRFVEPFGSPR